MSTRYPIKTVAHHEKELERLYAKAKVDAERREDMELSDYCVSAWGEGAMVDYHRKALEIAKAGYAAPMTVLVETATGREVRARWVLGDYGPQWLLARDEHDLIAKRGKQYLPTGQNSRILKSLGLHEEVREVPVRDYFEAHCAYVGAPMSFGLVRTDLEELLEEYERAAGLQYPDVDRLALLGQRVEAEADRVGYTSHSRLMALHTAAEQAADRAVQLDETGTAMERVAARAKRASKEG
jgi:hypothetical protein